MTANSSFPFRIFSVVAVSCYLALAYLYLRVTGQVRPPISLPALIAARFKKPYRGPVETIVPEQGYCFTTPVPEKLVSDKDGVSRLVVYEDGVPLPRAHSAHDEIRLTGNGGYSHWGNWVYFSARDNTDPRNNGRRYTVGERK